MVLALRKLIVKIRMAYADIRGHHGKSGTMSQVIIIWAERM